MRVLHCAVFLVTLYEQVPNVSTYLVTRIRRQSFITVSFEDDTFHKPPDHHPLTSVPENITSLTCVDEIARRLTLLSGSWPLSNYLQNTCVALSPSWIRS